MAQRGRKSAAALSVIAPASIPSVRPSPPSSLAADEAAEWNAIVQRMPAEHFQPENYPLLEDYCRTACLQRYLGARLAELRARSLTDDVTLGRVTEVARLYAISSERLSTLATKMRLTQQSRDPRRPGSTAATANLGPRRPWQT